jgi:DNA-binding MarR family transcriptional regulator
MDELRGTLATMNQHLEALREAAGVTPRSRASAAEGMLEARRIRDEQLGAELFAEPAWDMLLSLFIADEPGGGLAVSELCAASAVPHTTALRWIGSLATAGLVLRRTDERDARRTLISLTPAARATMSSLLSQMVGALSARAAPGERPPRAFTRP